MSPWFRTGFLRVLAFLAMLLFAGDLLGDSMAEICQKRCADETSQSAPCSDEGPCQCICTAHVGAVIATDFAIDFGSELQPAKFLAAPNAPAPQRLVAAIDHPPQLA